MLSAALPRRPRLRSIGNGSLLALGASLALFGSAIAGCGSAPPPGGGIPSAAGAGAREAARSSMALGAEHACVIAPTGRVHCWGSNFLAQIDTSGRALFPDPVEIPGITDATQLDATGSRTCALDKAGAVYCWGGTTLHLEIVGSNTGQSHSSVATAAPLAPLKGLGPVAAIAVGDRHVCVLERAGAVKCSGGNGYGQLGDGSTTDRDDPVTVPGLTGAVALTTGGSFTCALLGDGTVRCWGSFSTSGEAQFTRPVPVSGLPPLRSILANSSGLCALTADDALICFSSPEITPTGATAAPQSLAQVPGASLLEARSREACVRNEKGAAQCFGLKGTDAFTKSLALFAKVATGAIVSLKNGSGFECARFDDGQVACAGDNDFGQLGNGESHSVYPPHDIPGAGPATDVLSLWNTSCALGKDTLVRCWGGDDKPDDKPSAAAPIAGLTGVVKLLRVDTSKSPGPGYDLCATTTTGSFHCVSAGPGNTATLIDGLTNVRSATSIDRAPSAAPSTSPSAAGLQYAALTQGEVVAWLPLEEAGKVHAWKVPVPALSGLVHLHASGPYACGAHQDGRVLCWVPEGFSVDDSTSPPKITASAALTSPRVLVVPGVSEAQEIGHGFSWCARTRRGDLSCWSLDLKDGALVATEPKLQPAYGGAKSLASLADGGTFDELCAVVGPDNHLLCDHRFGGASGALQGMIEGAPRPFGATALSLSKDGGCLVRDGGEVACFGANRGKSKGSPAREKWETPVRVLLPRK